MSMGSILLVEDDLHILKTTADWLKEVGFTVTNASTLSLAKDALHRAHFDVVISDIAANTTGNRSLDCIRTNQLCKDVVEFSSKILKPNGVLVSKLFMGDDFIEVKELAKSRFKKVKFFKPEASRNESKETYLHCVTLKTL